MNIINVSKSLDAQETKEIIGNFAQKKDYDILVNKETLAIDENGNELFSFIPNAIPNDIARKAYKPLFKAAKHTNNRNTATKKNAAEYLIKKDGTVSNTRGVYSQEILSGIVGYFDRYVRTPFCRLTSYTEKENENWQKIVPVIKKIDECYSKYCPKTYKMQKKIADSSSQDFVIKNTAFTTGTVNRNWQTAYHRDAANLDGGMAGMTVVGSGKYDGGYLVFPEYRIAVDIKSTDVIIMNNTHLVHGNTKIIGKLGTYNRISLVCYFRQGMTKCGTMIEEVERAKKHGAYISREIHDDKSS